MLFCLTGFTTTSCPTNCTNNPHLADLTGENQDTLQVVELTNVKLSLKSNSKTSLDLPTITANASFKELPQLNFLQKVLDEVVNKGISTVVLSYKATNDITTSVTFSMKIDGKFSF